MSLKVVYHVPIADWTKSSAALQKENHSPAESIEDREDLPQFPIFDDIDGLQELSMPLNTSSSSTRDINPLEQELSQHKPHMLCKLIRMGFVRMLTLQQDQQQAHRLTPEERTRRLSILSTRGIPMQQPAMLTSPFFPSFKLQDGVHFPKYIPAIPPRILSEDIDYLRKKGAFLIPETGLRNELLRCYVQYVHPYLPVLDLSEFLTTVDQDDCSATISLLLFQAVMFAATAYIDLRYLTAQGYDSRKAARKAFFQRVKLLYDFDYEIDRVTVVQSVLLMTYWYESPDDPKDVWHWLGVAISLARTIGINCDTSSTPLSLEKQKLWKRIWWSCYMRDRLVAIGMRRPIRIKDDEANVPMLEISDFETNTLPPELNRMIGGCSVMRDAAKREMLAQMCIAMVKCCQCITKVLSVQYSMLGHRLGATQETTMRLVPKKSAANPLEVFECDRDIEEWYESLPIELRYFKSTLPREQNVRNDGEVINLHRALLTGVYLTTTSALHRPQMMPAMPNLVIEPELKELSQRRVREAACAITDVFQDLYSRDLIRYLPNTGVTILLPAIIVHLLDIKSPDSATRQLSVRRFQFCMQALQKLREMYASADFAFSFLDAAVRNADVPVGPAQESKQNFRDNQQLRSMSMSSCTKPGRSFTATLTPPPELPTMQQIRARASTSPSRSSGMFGINPQAMSLSRSPGTDFTALTPPSSDKMVHMNESATTGGAAVSLLDFNHMHHSPPNSVHDEHMGISNGGYIEADKLEELENSFQHVIDEVRMENDFDQLINLEGGSGGVDHLFTDSLNESDDSTSIWAGLTMSMNEPKASKLAKDLPQQRKLEETSLNLESVVQAAQDLAGKSSRQELCEKPVFLETMEEAIGVVG
ncbi:hypothetical protein LTR64_001886 [Lithohypha guttulata]|uniref:uncharacterized protein n=1 Tax=Lithohypha guttulata TaxID=1690604 RepID=UPI002DDE35E0|nr:hypothetical protein LTR51_007745 [Lithohypha guttulata]